MLLFVNQNSTQFEFDFVFHSKDLRL